ncbi:MAG TPA: hypothetical protein VGP79_10635 [Bryobacteraceae bacterium]|nr:hypothetical protein [Bryobacteraceae bacterium]
MRFLLLAILLVPLSAQAVRMGPGPIITPESSPSIGSNINGPSLLRVPAWVAKPLGKYYLYFAHHGGKFIRLAYANDLQGPWTVHEPGVLQLNNVPACRDHIASPDVHVDQDQRQIRMYFHCPAAQLNADMRNQKTLVSFSTDGLNFAAKSELLGPSYFRVFRWRGDYYAIARGGVFLRSKDGVSKFDEGPTPFPRDPLLRHAAVDLVGDSLSVYYSRIGDSPESILLSKIRLTPDWMEWKTSPPVTLISPATDAEGASLPSQPSKSDAAPGRVRQLRDPAFFREEGKTYLLYSIAGESGISIAALK